MADGQQPVLIGLDWGTSSARVYLIGEGGAVVDQISTHDGILTVEDGNFERVFDRLVGSWPAVPETAPIIASGMITSRNGWIETPYLQPPAGAADFAAALRPYVTAAGRRVHFVTGLSIEDSAGAPDVLRGEETEILGHLANDGVEGDGRLYVVPGTHCKWVDVSGGRLTHFATYVTGELYAILKDHSILGRLIADGPFSGTAFDAGATVGLEQGDQMLHTLFAARTLPLFERLTPVEAADYLSGLLIGSEVAAALAKRNRTKPATIIGSDVVVDRYERALTLAGVRADRAEQAMVARGHWEIAMRAELIS